MLYLHSEDVNITLSVVQDYQIKSFKQTFMEILCVVILHYKHNHLSDFLRLTHIRYVQYVIIFQNTNFGQRHRKHGIRSAFKEAITANSIHFTACTHSKKRKLWHSMWCHLYLG